MFNQAPPQGSSGWFDPAWLYIRANGGKDLGPKFENLLAAWFTLEKTYKFKYVACPNDPKNKRPSQIDHWIRSGRTKLSTPRISSRNRPKFGEDLCGWWWAAQTTGRHGREPWLRPLIQNVWQEVEDEADEWISNLRKPGKDGIYTFVAGLVWWGAALWERLEEDKQEVEKWEKLVDDVAWVCEILVKLENGD